MTYNACYYIVLCILLLGDRLTGNALVPPQGDSVKEMWLVMEINRINSETLQLIKKGYIYNYVLLTITKHHKKGLIVIK